MRAAGLQLRRLVPCLGCAALRCPQHVAGLLQQLSPCLLLRGRCLQAQCRCSAAQCSAVRVQRRLCVCQ